MTDPEAEPPDDVVARAVDDFLDRLQQGEQPEIEAYVREHPEAADTLRRVLPTLAAMHATPETLDEAAEPQGTPHLGQLGDFRLIREIGRGGMGVVYEAEQISLQRRVALKVLPSVGMLDRRQLRRFQIEAQAAAQLHHSHLVPVYGVGSERGTHYYAMQYIEGQSLREILRELRARETGDRENPDGFETDRAGPLAASLLAGRFSARDQASHSHDDHEPTRTDPLPPTSGGTHDSVGETSSSVVSALTSTTSTRSRPYFRSVATLVVQAAEALEHAHANGVVHRDVKPGNLLVDTDGQLWVTDFGLAQIQNNVEVTLSGDVLGSARYMSPEQASAKHAVMDHRTDVFSLGVTLYELLTLTPAFDGPDREAVLRTLVGTDPSPPRKLNPAIPVELETIVLKAIRKDPADRYETAGALATDLRRFLEDRPILARRPTVPQRVAKWARRNQPVVWAAAAVLLLATAASTVNAYLIWQHQQATQEALAEARKQRRVAERARRRAEENAAAAEKQRKLAARRASQADAVVDFLLEDMLRSASPNKARGRELTVKEVFAKAGKRIDDAFQDQPLVEAEIRSTLATVYHHLADYRKAKEHAERAYRLRKKHLSPDHPKVLSAQRKWGHQLYHAGKTDRAEKVLRSVVDRQRTAGKGSGEASAAAVRSLAWVHLRKGDYKKAERVLRGRLAKEEPKKALGQALFQQGEEEDARRILERATRIQTERLGSDHPHTLRSKIAFARVLKKNGHQSRACRLLTDVLSAALRVVGADHPITLDAARALARISRGREEPPSARPLLRKVAARAQQSLRREDPYLDRWRDLGEVLRYQGRYKEARQIFWGILRREQRREESPSRQTAMTARHFLQLFPEAAPLDRIDARRIGPANYCSWGPKGRRVVAWRKGRGLEVVDLESGSRHTLVESGKDPAWSPAGPIAYVRAGEKNDLISAGAEQNEIWRVDPATGERRKIVTGAWPTWSQDGKTLYYHSREAGAVRAVSIDDPTEKRTVYEVEFPYPAVAPTGEHIAYKSKSGDGSAELVVDRIRGDEVGRWKLPGWGFTIARWSPSGRYLALASPGCGAGLWLFDLRTKRFRHVVWGPFAVPTWSHDGQKLAFVRRLDGAKRVAWSAPLEAIRKLPSHERPYEGAKTLAERAQRVAKAHGLGSTDPKTARISAGK